MVEACKNQNLQPKTDFLKKCIELYETIMVRHGLMVVGGAFSGKSKVIKVL
jgi:dynein heavy chain